MAELTRTDKKQLENSYEFGFKTFWECLEKSKDKNLDSEAVGMEILYQAIHFLETKGWSEDDIFEFMKNAYKDIIDNQLYQNQLSKMKVEHRGAGELTDDERAILSKEKKILKEGDYANVSSEVDSKEIMKKNNSIDIPTEVNSEELATA